MTKEEEREVIRVCGKDYDYLDIPAIIRRRDEKRRRWMEQRKSEEHRQEDLDEKEREKLGI